MFYVGKGNKTEENERIYMNMKKKYKRETLYGTIIILHSLDYVVRSHKKYCSIQFSHCYFFLMGFVCSGKKYKRTSRKFVLCREKGEKMCSLKSILLHKRFSCHSPHSQGSLTLTGREIVYRD